MVIRDTSRGVYGVYMPTKEGSALQKASRDSKVTKRHLYAFLNAIFSRNFFCILDINWPDINCGPDIFSVDKSVQGEGGLKI